MIIFPIFAQEFFFMNFNKILLDFIQQVRVHPNVTAFKINDALVTNAQFAQKIAPIMNELDTLNSDNVAILMENDVQTYAAMVACMLSNKKLILVNSQWSESQKSQVLSLYNVSEVLTANRMNYYYWMTVEDAIDRIDSGLIQVADEQIVATVHDFSSDGQLKTKEIRASEINSLNVVKHPFL